jgi:hypothetical protein
MSAQERSLEVIDHDDPCANSLPYRKTILRNSLQPLKRDRTRSSSVPSKKVSFIDQEKGLPLKEVFEFPKDKPSLSIKDSACCLLS